MQALNLLFITFLLLLLSKCQAKDYCSSEYCANSKQHTLCKYESKEPASHCVDYERTISNEIERKAILNKLNSRRNKVAAGEIRSLPSAGSMMKLEWNEELEISAQRWADQCVKHDVPDVKDACRDLGDVYTGQNIATIHGDAPGLTPLSLVDVWYMELLTTNASIISFYEPSSETSHSHYDYFTQLVWDESNQVGCGSVKFKEILEDEHDVKYRTMYRLVCNFAPGGNLRNKTVYSSGIPCSRCPVGSACDPVYKALCGKMHPTVIKEKDDNKIVIGSILRNLTTQNVFPNMFGMLSEDNPDITETTTEIINTSSEFNSDESYTTFDYFSHLYEYTKQMITESTMKPSSCKDILEVDDFVDLLKKKLSSDPMIKELLATTKSSGSNGNSDGIDNDDGVAAFINRVYSKKEPTTTTRASEKDNVNSTLLVDLIEAVIFRNGDKFSVTEEMRSNTQPISVVKPVMIQAELGEIKQNQDFTGHYFFPEDEDEELTSETTESYYDNSNIPVSDVVMEIDDLKLSTATQDFLDDILESDTATENPYNVLINKKIDGYINKRDFLLQDFKRMKRKSEFFCKNGYENNQPNQLPEHYKKQFAMCRPSESSKITITYREVLRKLVDDLRQLQLNHRFRCTWNNSNINNCDVSLIITLYIFFFKSYFK